MNRDLSLLSFQRIYDPCADGTKLIDEFYLPCLANSCRYDRCSAYFSGASLINMANGLEKFAIDNNGKIRFIFSCDISEDEMKDIQNGYKQKMDNLAESIKVDELDCYQLSNLSYLIANGIAEVKIAFMLGSKTSLMHSKFGIFEDEKGNSVYFLGSGNETKQGILDNAELIQVTSSNNPAFKLDIEDGRSRFDRMWNNTYAPDSIRVEYPCGILFEKLISFNKGKIFIDKADYYTFLNSVYIDINQQKDCIIINDYTKEKYLQNNMVCATYFDEHWIECSDNNYIIDRLNLSNLRDLLIPSLKNMDINYILSKRTIDYIEKYDMRYNERIKLALAIKNNTNTDLWLDKYYRFKKIVDMEMTARLKDQQMLNAFFHYAMKSSADFSVPGTGKTYISYGLYAFLSSEVENHKVNKIVVFGPLNCFKAWKDEGKSIFLNRRNLTFFDINHHHGDFEEDVKNNKYDVYLINYEYVNEFKIDIINKYIIDEKTLLIFDEIHKLKNPKGKRASNFISLIDNAESKPIYKLALTGTPIPNSFSDLYNYIQILYPDEVDGIFNNLSINQLNNADKSYMLEENVSKSIQPLFVRTTKKDLKIPEAQPDNLTDLCVESSDYESELFNLVLKAYTNPLVRFIRLIQASSNPELLLSSIDKLDFESLYDNDDDLMESFESMSKVAIYNDDMKKVIQLNPNSGKFMKTVKKIEHLVSEGKKVIVWCLFIGTIDKLRNILFSKGIKAITITGRDNPIDREGLIDDFKNRNIKVLITNPNTLAESVSLHKVCHNAIYLEYGFNLTYLLQSKDRIHRVGLKDSDITNYYFAITKDINSVDEYVYERLKFKSDRMTRVIESNDLILYKDDDDIKDILNMVSTL